MWHESLSLSAEMLDKMVEMDSRRDVGMNVGDAAAILGPVVLLMNWWGSRVCSGS